MNYFCLSDGMQDLLRPWMSPLPEHGPADDRSEDASATFGHYRALFELARAMPPQAPMRLDLVGFASARMFATPAPVPGRSSIQDTYQVVDPLAFDESADEVLLPRGQSFVLPGIYSHQVSLLNHYLRTHPTRDLLFFLGIALDLEVVESRALALYLGRDVWITHPAISVVPKPWFVETMSSLEAVATACAATAPSEAGGRTGEALVRCIEILHSLLLMQVVNERSRSEFTINPLVKVAARTAPPAARESSRASLGSRVAIDLTSSRGLPTSDGAAGQAQRPR